MSSNNDTELNLSSKNVDRIVLSSGDGALNNNDFVNTETQVAKPLFNLFGQDIDTNTGLMMIILVLIFCVIVILIFIYVKLNSQLKKQTTETISDIIGQNKETKTEEQPQQTGDIEVEQEEQQAFETLMQNNVDVSDKNLVVQTDSNELKETEVIESNVPVQKMDTPRDVKKCIKNFLEITKEE